MIIALPVDAMAQTPVAPCIAASEARDLATFAMPTAIHVLDTACTKVLPSETGFSQSVRALEDQYKPASDAAWPAARVAMQKLLNLSKKSDAGKKLISNMLLSDDPAALRGFVAAAASETTIPATSCSMVARLLPLIKSVSPKEMSGILELAAEVFLSDHNPTSIKGDPSPVRYICPGS